MIKPDAPDTSVKIGYESKFMGLKFPERVRHHTSANAKFRFLPLLSNNLTQRRANSPAEQRLLNR